MRIFNIFLMVMLLTSPVLAQTPAYLPDASLKTSIDIAVKPLTKNAAGYDLSFLNAAIKSNKVLLLGEGHWMNEINSMLSDIVFHANTVDNYPFLALEIPFSATAHLNAYINAAEADAAAYLEPIKPFFKSEASVKLLNRLREWNKKHPTKKITVGCTDMEQGVGFPLRQVFDVYFKAAGNDQLIPRVKADGLTPKTINFMDSLINRTSHQFVVAKAPFLTKTFLQQCMISLRAVYEASKIEEQRGYEGYLEARIRQIVRNLTTDNFFGKQVREGKSILWGGANHMKKYFKPSDTSTTRMEGDILANNFDPTKGKVFSIRVDNFAYAAPANAYSNENYKTGTESYVTLVDLYKKDNPTYKTGRYRILDQLTSLSTTLTVKSQQLKAPVYFYRNAAIQAGSKYPALKKDEKLEEYLFHDLVIVIPGTTLYSY